jgi:hypothetical protein
MIAGVHAFDQVAAVLGAPELDRHPHTLPRGIGLCLRDQVVE